MWRPPHKLSGGRHIKYSHSILSRGTNGLPYSQGASVLPWEFCGESKPPVWICEGAPKFPKNGCGNLANVWDSCSGCTNVFPQNVTSDTTVSTENTV